MHKKRPGLAAQTTLVALAPEIAAAFPTSEAVNRALRGLLREHEARLAARAAAKKAAAKKR